MRAVFPIWLVLLAACGQDPDDTSDPVDTTDTDPTGTGTGTGTEPTDGAPACVANVVVPSIAECTFATGLPAAVHFELKLDGAVVRTTDPGASGTSHDATFTGLKAGHTYEVVAVTDGGVTASAQHTVEDPQWRPEITVMGTPTHPYVLTSIINDFGSWPAIFDAEGDLVWWTETELGSLVTTTRLSADGESVLYAAYDLDWSEDRGRIYRVALDGSSVTETRALLAHHDFLEHADGTVSWFGYDYRDYGGTMWASDVIHRAPEGSEDETGGELVFSWFDDYGQDPWLADPEALSVSLGTADFEWTHSNSLMQIPEFDGYFVMSKFLDTVLKIDRSGAVVWEMGGANSDFTNPDGTPVFRGLEDLDLWSHAHMSDLWDGGLLVFDNGAHNGPGGTALSRVVEYEYDEATKVVQEVWAYENPEGRFTNLMGDAKKLANGNVLLSWSTLGYMEERDPDGGQVWGADLAQGQGISSRVTPIDAL